MICWDIKTALLFIVTPFFCLSKHFLILRNRFQKFKWKWTDLQNFIDRCYLTSIISAGKYGIYFHLLLFHLFGPAILFTEGRTYVLIKQFCRFWLPVCTGGKIDTPIPHWYMMVPPPPSWLMTLIPIVGWWPSYHSWLMTLIPIVGWWPSYP